MNNRQAGRSTATLKNALEVLKSGSNVTYVSTNHKHSELLCAQARELLHREIDPSGAQAGDYKFQRALILKGSARLQFQSPGDTRYGSFSVLVPDHAAYELVEQRYHEAKQEVRIIRAELETLQRAEKARLEKEGLMTELEHLRE